MAEFITTIQRWIGLSTDSKPATAKAGSKFVETDTGAVYTFTAGAWAIDIGTYLATKSITFTAGGAGLQGAETDIFAVTGEVQIVSIVPFCVTTLERDAPTPVLKLGSPPTTTLFITSTDITDITGGNFWVAPGTPYPGIDLPDRCKDAVFSTNVTCQVAGTNNIQAGVIRFDVYWKPLSSNGLLVPA